LGNKFFPIENKIKMPDPSLQNKNRNEKPKSLQREVQTRSVPFYTAFKLDDLPVMVYEDASIKATIKLAGKIVIKLANSVPIMHATNRGLETIYVRQTEAALMKLFVHESKVEWDSVSNKITYRCMLVANSKSPGMVNTAVGLAVASDKPVPVIRGEIRFPKISGHIDRHFYDAKKVRICRTGHDPPAKTQRTGARVSENQSQNANPGGILY
jgi:hypothetical protein